MQATVMASLPSALKRKSVDAGQALAAPAQQLKRARVSFDPHTLVHPLTDTVLNEKPLSLVREDVWRALERHQRGGGGEDRDYTRLRHILQHSNDPLDDSNVSNRLLQKYFVALTSHSHMMGRNCGALVAAALDCDWLLRDEHFFVDFQQFITTFLASQSSYVPMVLGWMLKTFSDGETRRPAGHEVTKASSSEEPPANRESPYGQSPRGAGPLAPDARLHHANHPDGGERPRKSHRRLVSV
jgi:RNA polymerase I specific transcription initiation factor RRN3